VEGYIDMLFAAKSARNDWYKIVNVVYKNEVMDGALHFKCIDVGERGEHVYIECSEIMTNSKNKQYVLRKPNDPVPFKRPPPRRKFSPYRYELVSDAVSSESESSGSDVDVNAPRRTRLSSRSL
jgi:hypothetical protein